MERLRQECREIKNQFSVKKRTACYLNTHLMKNGDFYSVCSGVEDILIFFSLHYTLEIEPIQPTFLRLHR